ncbi:hypothetical protein AAFF_G00323500 [Aldrovandia affinis]|uniref:Uncharacterized protein n=1 Tax=Aldrovandia affinis TaxID=143900 RepID=A0AAD7R734_9TELE|nr:hypothetical protein AAFF_G00323500 [Aldrovandia affinis]
MAVIPVLMTVEELSGVTFGHRSPRHGLKLLHWFSAECVKFYEDRDMELQCDPDNGDYGFHHYGNFEDLLPSCDTYFEVGNLNTFIHFGAQDLPAYVREAYRSQRNSYDERNKDRIIISLDRATRLIGEVYITEHLPGRRDFDPDGTYLLSLDILRQAGNSRLFDFLTRARFSLIMNLVGVPGESFDSFPDSDKTEDEGEEESCGSGEWEGLESRTSSPSSEQKDYPKYLYRKKQSFDPKTMVVLLDLSAPQLEVRTTWGGNALVTWHGVPRTLAYSTWVGLFRGNAEPDESYLVMIRIEGRTSGSQETSEPLNHGLQVRFFTDFLSYSTWRGPEFDATGGVDPTPIPGFQAALQLYTENGYVLARLYIYKAFADWRSIFYYSWVGLYALDGDGATKYKTYQWAMSFTKETRPDRQEALDYDVYLYQFGDKRIAPGVQARFFTSRGYSEERTRTEPWEGGGTGSLRGTFG